MPGRKRRVQEFALSCLLPGACLVFDRFRVIKKMNETLDDLLWDLARQAQNREGKTLIKGKRWLLLKRLDRLTAAQAEVLNETLALNQDLACAYILKEDLGLLWKQPDKEAGRLFLWNWRQQALASGIRQLQTMVKTLHRHAAGILKIARVQVTAATAVAVRGGVKQWQIPPSVSHGQRLRWD